MVLFRELPRPAILRKRARPGSPVAPACEYHESVLGVDGYGAERAERARRGSC